MVDFPNRPDDPHLPRAAIVISTDLRNVYADSVLVIPVMSDEALPRLLPSQVAIAKGTGGLYKDSRAMCEQICSIDKRKFVGARLGTIPSVILSSLVQALKKAVE
jgi:mRNA-degrading endonuclease toxin of MazEF toxin-antitoxin module